MLSLLAAPDELAEAGPFSVALNVASVLGPEFQRFDATLPPALRGHVLIELQTHDILADPESYLLARDFVRLRGFRVGLAGVNASLLGLAMLAHGDFDALLLHWSQELAAISPEAIVRATGSAADVVLCKSDDRSAITWGLANGIRLFQGRFATRH